MTTKLSCNILKPENIFFLITFFLFIILMLLHLLSKSQMNQTIFLEHIKWEHPKFLTKEYSPF